MNSFEKLKTKLAELFQLDQADLDFGIYRIMNARRDEITRFLESDLLPQAREAFGEYKSSDKAEIQKELDEAEKQASDLGVEPDDVPKVKELRAKYETSSVDVTALENEVFDHLYGFFSRYYDEGDFISLRRYKEGVYAIPYEGEEVKLHWANHDQYYIKTTEYFRDYAFKTQRGQRVHFKIAEADTEKDNIKAANGNDRRFLLHGDKPVVEENGELVIRFEYRPDSEKRRQDAINADTAKRVVADLNTKELAVWQHRLSPMWKRAGGKETDKTILDKRLFDYTRRNTFDYFIHKDLEGFLRRELDFYIKNEVMRLDDIEEESAPRVEQYLSKIKVIRRIAHKIIDFLAQIENFQKKLWLKKKFVVETNYCVTLDRVPEELYPEIATNDAQREEWVRLFAIDEIEGDMYVPAYSEPLTVEFLKANLFLMLDTRFFDEKFKARLIASIENFDEHCDGLLIHSENFQALNLMQERYREQVKCVYIDPPYNTGQDDFLYKDQYQRSSWLSFLHDRLTQARLLLSPKGMFFSSIDFLEESRLREIADHVFGTTNFLAKIIWEKRFTRSNNAKLFSTVTENVLAYRRSVELSLLREPRSEKADSTYSNPDNDPRGPWTSVSYVNPATKEARPNLSYLLINPITGAEVSHPTNAWKYEKSTYEKHVENNRLYWGSNGGHTYPRLKKFLNEMEGMVPVELWKHDETGTTDSASKLLEAEFGKKVFEFPKPPSLMRRVINLAGYGTNAGVYLDFFAGTAPTGHAVINLNREDNGNRKYILVEMGDHFDAVLKPRIQKVVYSKDWKEGKPVSREGVSHMFKYIRLESYEDALANIELQRTGSQESLLDSATGFRESYMLKYMLDVESRSSQALLNIDDFDDPWNYKLLVGAGSVGETMPVNADLAETFNWLLGLKVKHIDRISGFQVVEGENPNGEKVLVIWRKVRDLDETDIKKIATARKQANHDLEAFFTKQQYNTLDSEFDVIYVNGDNNLMNVPLDLDKEGVEPRYKVRLTEEEFKRLMFDVAGL